MAQWWRWFVRGLGIWLVAAALLTTALAGEAAPMYREARHFMAGVASSVSPSRALTDDFAPIAHTGGNLFGVNTFLYQEVEEEKIRRSLALIKAAGFGYIREQVAWQEIERGEKGNYWDERWDRSTWHKLDQLVGLVREYDLEMVVRLDYPPDWAVPEGTTWHATPPANYEDYGDFVYTLASRYRGQLRYYQVWNEPNLTIEWGMQPVNPADYVRLLQIAYTRAKEADPEAVVIAAALAPTIEQGPLNLSDLEFLRQMYEAGAKDYFDIASVNPYGLRSGPDDRRFSAEDTNFSRPIQAREIMVHYGDAGKPIWASETGWCVLPPDFPAAPVYGRTTYEQQARYTHRAYERVQEEWPWLGMMALWHFRMVDNRMAAEQPYYFGVVADDFSPFPVYERLQSVATAPPTLYPGYRQEDHRAIEYVGTWRMASDERAALGGYAAASGAGAGAVVRFWGTGVDLVVTKGPEGGRVAVRVDGTAASANAIVRDEYGRAVVDLGADAEAWQVRVPVARGLPLREHTLEIDLLDGRGSLYLDGIIVRAEESRSIVPLLLALIVGLVLFVIWARSQGGTPT